MESPFGFGAKLQHLCTKVSRTTTTPFFHFVLYRVHPFCHHLFYFSLLSLLGFLSLKLTNPRTNTIRPNDLDLFFTSVSASTVSSMSTVQMEDFSNAQLLILTLLMFLGGEVFVSMIGLHFSGFKLSKTQTSDPTIGRIELPVSVNNNLKYHSIKSLTCVVLVYLLVTLAVGSTLVSLYLLLIPSASQVLERKRIPIQIFSLFTTVSTFTNCGFTPNNENMMIFKENSGLLLILIPQILLGSTLYPFCLRMVIWVMNRLRKTDEYSFILKNYNEVGYASLMMPSLLSSLSALTAVGLLMLQFVLFCLMEWSSEGLKGLNSYQKFVGSLFQAANTRHSGENIVDLSTLTPAILVIFVLMMYLPADTTFVPTGSGEEVSPNRQKRTENKKYCRVSSVTKNLKLSQLSYLVIFVALICVTERDKLSSDPLNFNVFNIIVEVTSAYGNVGYSMGYSCERRLTVRPGEICQDMWYGFVGHWSKKGKLILILVMFFGRLKKFHRKGGKKIWRLS